MPRIHNHWNNLSPTSTRNTVDWRQEGNCANLKNPDAMYPAATDTFGIEGAKLLCDTCPVLKECRTWALEQREEWGVWGGLSETERRNIWRNNRPKGCGTENGWQAHGRRGERVCQPCATAHGRYIAANRRAALEREHAKGGTPTGLTIHLRLKEKPCWKCLEANARNNRERKAAAKQGRVLADGPRRPGNLTRGQMNALAKRRIAGQSPSILALEYGVSESRVRQIVRAYKDRITTAA